MNIEVKYSSHYPLRHIAAKQRYGLSCLRRPLNERAQRYDYGARQYDPTAPRFTTPDPLAEKYYGWNMYGYCMNNPIRFIDPSGMIIEEGSLKQWNKLREVLDNKINKLRRSISHIYDKAESKGWGAEKISKKIGEAEIRLSSLYSSLNAMNCLEQSDVLYSLSKSNESIGQVTYNGKTIDIQYSDNSNFFHELEHGLQFELGEIGFMRNGSVVAIDITDEINAYKAQYAFNPSSVKNLTSSTNVSKMSDINTAWLLGITVDNNTVYGTQKYPLGKIPVNINSSTDDINKAYGTSLRNYTYIKDNKVIYKK